MHDLSRSENAGAVGIAGPESHCLSMVFIARKGALVRPSASKSQCRLEANSGL